MLLGRISKQFETFLRSHGYTWSSNDIENAVNRFRLYFSSLLQLARDRKEPPRGYKDMQCLVDKTYVERRYADGTVQPRARTPSTNLEIPIGQQQIGAVEQNIVAAPQQIV